jgi:hypothetical protein
MMVLITYSRAWLWKHCYGSLEDSWKYPVPVRGLLERSYPVLSICHNLDADSIRGILLMAYLTKMADN